MLTFHVEGFYYREPSTVNTAKCAMLELQNTKCGQVTSRKGSTEVRRGHNLGHTRGSRSRIFLSSMGSWETWVFRSLFLANYQLRVEVGWEHLQRWQCSIIWFPGSFLRKQLVYGLTKTVLRSRNHWVSNSREESGWLRKFLEGPLNSGQSILGKQARGSKASYWIFLNMQRKFYFCQK